MIEPQFREHIRYLEPLAVNTTPEGSLVKPVKAVLFDIYGTLFISGCGDLGVSADRTASPPSLGKLLRRFGIKASAPSLVAKLFQTIRNEHLRMQANGIDFPEIDIEAVWQSILGWQDVDRVRHFAIAFEWVANPTYPMPGLDHTLRVLRNRGVTLGLISNAQFYTPLLFNWFLGAPPQALGFDMDLTVYSYRHGEAKPSKTLFETCSDVLRDRGMRRSSIVYLGNDRRNDIWPASEMGWQTILFAGDRRSLRWRMDCPECQSVYPDLVIKDLRELLDWI